MFVLFVSRIHMQTVHISKYAIIYEELNDDFKFKGNTNVPD
jgi:hypothetical protein